MTAICDHGHAGTALTDTSGIWTSPSARLVSIIPDHTAMPRLGAAIVGGASGTFDHKGGP